MRRISEITVIGILIGVALILITNAGADEYDRGRKLYSDKCQICHGMKGDGNGPAGAALSPKPANFTSPKFWQGDVDKKITETVENGHGMMPSFDLKPTEIKEIIDYLSHAFKPAR